MSCTLALIGFGATFFFSNRDSCVVVGEIGEQKQLHASGEGFDFVELVDLAVAGLGFHLAVFDGLMGVTRVDVGLELQDASFERVIGSGALGDALPIGWILLELDASSYDILFGNQDERSSGGQLIVQATSTA